LYDPATGTWSETGNLNGTRAWHAATLLRDGGVLIAGGWDGSSLLKTAEVYDPSTGTWSVTGSFNSLRGRFDYSLTPLQNGKVLAAGGSDTDDFGSALTNAELYDPNTGTWSVTGDLNTGRNGHSATVLPDGNLLIAAGHGFPCSGGFCYSTVNTSAEVYNPATGTWNYTGSLSRRSNHTATLLPNGQVLVVGGWNAGYDVGRFITLDTAETYDPATGRWTSIANLNSARYFHTATLLPNGKVLAVGGFGGSDGTLRSAELYDPGASTPVNPIDDPQFFVRQQYLDFLNREPDPLSAQWVSMIKNCAAGDSSCDSIHVSMAFFQSPEFQARGYFVYRFYSVAFGRKPDFAEFMPDLARVSGFLTNDQLEAAKTGFINDFMSRPAFTSQYGSLDSVAYIDALLNTAGVNLSNRQTLIDALNDGTATRAQILQQIVETSEVYQKYYNQAFVVMEYFGYLRRDPDILYLTWIQFLDSGASSRTMVSGFVNSIEYRQRFDSCAGCWDY